MGLPEEGSGWAKQEAEIKKQKSEGKPQTKQMCRASLLPATSCRRAGPTRALSELSKLASGSGGKFSLPRSLEE